MITSIQGNSLSMAGLLANLALCEYYAATGTCRNLSLCGSLKVVRKMPGGISGIAIPLTPSVKIFASP